MVEGKGVIVFPELSSLDVVLLAGSEIGSVVTSAFVEVVLEVFSATGSLPQPVNKDRQIIKLTTMELYFFIGFSNSFFV